MFEKRVLKSLSLLLCLGLLAVATGCTPTTVTLQQFPTTPDAVRALRGGTVDAVYGDFPAMAYAARESAGTLEVVRQQFETAPFGIALATHANELRDAVTAALPSIVESGTYTQILRTWALTGGRLPAPEGAGEIPEASAVPQLADGTLRIGMDIAFAPMGFNDEAGQLAGVDVELGRALGEALGVEVEFVNMEFDDLLPALGGGDIEMAMAAITVTEERAQTVNFIEYLRSGSAILVQSGNPQEIRYPAQMCGHTIGVQEGTVQISAIEAMTCY